VERFAAIYTPCVFAVAVLIPLLGTWLLGWTWLQGVYKGLVLLVIACPCALVISTRVTIISGMAAAARRGILIKGRIYLEEVRKIKAIALDKTGTVTEGKPPSSTGQSSIRQPALLRPNMWRWHWPATRTTRYRAPLPRDSNQTANKR